MLLCVPGLRVSHKKLTSSLHCGNSPTLNQCSTPRERVTLRHESNITSYLPAADVLHGRPRLLRLEGLTLLEQLDADAVGALHERHLPVPGRPVDHDTLRLQGLTQRVDVVRGVRQVAHAAARGREVLAAPVVGELDLGSSGGTRHEDQGELALLRLLATGLLEPESLEKVHGGVEIVHPEHGVQECEVTILGQAVVRI